MAETTFSSRTEADADAEAYALERMVLARCEQIRHFVEEAFPAGLAVSRETDFQIQAFAERRAKALDEVEAGREQALQIRLGQLEKLLEALECSWEFFRSNDPATDSPEDAGEWAILIK